MISFRSPGQSQQFIEHFFQARAFLISNLWIEIAE